MMARMVLVADRPASPFNATPDDLAAFAHVERLMAGFMMARALIMGHKLGVFRVLARGPVPMQVLARALSVRNLRSFEKLIEILVKLDLLAQTGGMLRNGAIAERSLVPGRPGYYGGFVDFFARQFVIKSEADLFSYTRDGVAIDQGKSFDWNEYMAAMDGMAEVSADRIAQALDLASTHTLLDLGGGTGAYAIAFADAFPRLQVTIRDLEEVRTIALAHVADSGHADRIRFKTGSFFDADYSARYDAIFISQTIHLFEEADVQRVFAIAHRHLNPGGQLIIRELFVDAETSEPLLGLLIGFQMWISGRAYTFQQTERMLRTAGFDAVERCPILHGPDGPHVPGAMLIGRKS